MSKYLHVKQSYIQHLHLLDAQNATCISVERLDDRGGPGRNHNFFTICKRHSSAWAERIVCSAATASLPLPRARLASASARQMRFLLFFFTRPSRSLSTTLRRTRGREVSCGPQTSPHAWQGVSEVASWACRGAALARNRLWGLPWHLCWDPRWSHAC